MNNKTEEIFKECGAILKGHFVLNVSNGSIVSEDPPQLTLIREIENVILVEIYENSTGGSLFKWQRAARLANVLVGDYLISNTSVGYTGIVTEVGVDSGGNYAIARTDGLINISGIGLNRPDTFEDAKCRQVLCYITKERET